MLLFRDDDDVGGNPSDLSKGYILLFLDGVVVVVVVVVVAVGNGNPAGVRVGAGAGALVNPHF